MTKNPSAQRVLSTVLAACALSLASCSSTSKVERSATSSYKEGVPGGVLVETYDTTATVTRLDTRKRTVTLLAPDGSYNTFAASPQDTTFDKLRVSEKVRMTVARELAAYLVKNGPPAGDVPSATSVLTAKEGDVPVMVSKPGQRAAVVAAVDAQQRLVTLKFTDGDTKTFPLRKDVVATSLNVGDQVVILTGSAVTLAVDKK